MSVIHTFEVLNSALLIDAGAKDYDLCVRAHPKVILRIYAHHKEKSCIQCLRLKSS